MTPLTRFLLSRALPVAALSVLAAGVTGCQGGNSTAAGTALSSTAPAVPARVSAATAVPEPPSVSTAVTVSPSAGHVVYLAEGGAVGGTALHAPACRAGCQLSGDSTTSLWNMTWRTWNSAEAAGSGTEKLNDCTPDCASGTLHPVPVAVTLSRPVMVCVSGTAAWFWTRASFTWPDGLPVAFSGGNAPLNPFDYPDIAARAAKSCS